VPGLGLILGPVKVLLKGGGMVAKAFRGAVAVGDSSKLASLGAKSGVIGKLISSVGGWGVALLGVLTKVGERVPGLRVIIKGIKSLIGTFTGAKNLMGKSAIHAATDMDKIPSLGSKLKGKPSLSPDIDVHGGKDPISNMMSSMFGAK